MMKKESKQETQKLQKKPEIQSLKSPNSSLQTSSKNTPPPQTTLKKITQTNQQLPKKTSTINSQKVEVNQISKIDQNIVSEFPRVKSILIKLIKASQFKTSIKELEDILKVNAQKIKLKIDTKFEFDSDLLNFTVALIKISHKINHLKWIVKGQFTDNQSKVIGDSLAKFTNAFRIDLKIQSDKFGDKGANSLALGIKNLQNLHILKIHIPNLRLRTSNKTIETAVSRINESIAVLQNLEVIYFDRLDWKDQPIPKNISSQLYYLQCSNYSEKEDLDELKNTFFQQIGEMQNKITHLYIRNDIFYYNDEIKSCIASCVVDEELDPVEYAKALIQIIQYCFNFPYLTKFNDLIVNSEKLRMLQIQEQLSMNQQYNKYVSFIHNFTNKKLLTIMQTIAFHTYIAEIFTINPSMILIDLLID